MYCLDNDNQAGVTNDKLLFYAQDTIDLTWSEAFFNLPEPFHEKASPILINIALHILNSNYEIEMVSDLANRITNTGSATVTVPMISHSSNQAAYAAKISIEAVSTFYDGVQGTVTQWTDIIWIVSDNTDAELWPACQEWERRELSSIGPELLKKVRDHFPCPHRIGLARTATSGLIEDADTKLINFFHPDVFTCFHQRTTM